MNRDELDIATADVEAAEALASAKESFRDDPSDENHARLIEAQETIFALRSHWREVRAWAKAVREADGEPPEEGVAAPETITTGAST